MENFIFALCWGQPTRHHQHIFLSPVLQKQAVNALILIHLGPNCLEVECGFVWPTVSVRVKIIHGHTFSGLVL